jgi:hypothetical protein
MAAFLQFLKFLNWKTDGKWKMENALVFGIGSFEAEPWNHDSWPK